MKKAVILLIAVLFISCEDDLIPASSVESNIQVELREIPGVESSTFSLFCKTEKIYPCCNFPIRTKLSFKDNALKVDFLEVEDEGICLTALGPATTEINLSTLKKGSYEIELNNAGFINKGTLTVTDAAANIQIKNQRGIKITHPTLQRVPSRTYWGVVGYHSESTISKVNEFFDKLKKMGASFTKQTPGYYFYYEIDKDGEIVKRGNDGYYFSKYFIFQYVGDEESFNRAVKELSVSYFDGLSIQISTYRGDFIYNWQTN